MTKIFQSKENPLESVRKAGIICCSNGLSVQQAEKLHQLEDILKTQGITVQYSDCIVAGIDARSGSAQQRAQSLMHFYCDSEIDAIFDVSGGDIANEILSYLDQTVLLQNKQKLFWGYSDLTVVLNAIYAMTGNLGALYHMRHYIGQHDLFSFAYSFIQGNSMQGIIIGGNIRCLLKLAGTKYFPNMQDKILLLEARSGGVPQMITYFSQLQQLGVFDQINGVLLGTFTQMEREQQQPTIEQLMKQFTKVPIAKTMQIGHAPDAKAIVIGKCIKL